MMSNSTVQSTLRAWKIMKNFTKHKIIAVDSYLYLWSFLDFRRKILGKLDKTEKSGFDIRVQQEKKKLSEQIAYCPVTWKKV